MIESKGMDELFEEYPDLVSVYQGFRDVRARRRAVEWLLDEGCSLAEDAASGAAEGGHLEALKWLVNHGCPWSGSVWNYAVKGRHVEVMEWLRAEGCGGC